MSFDIENLDPEYRHFIEHAHQFASTDRIQRLRAFLTHAFTHPDLNNVKLGNNGKPYQPKVALSEYLETQAQPPPRVHRGLWAGYADILANDRLGDCGPAMIIHGLECLHHAAGTRIPPFVTQDAITFYSQEAGYVAGDESTDQGSDNQTMFDLVKSAGVKCGADNSVHGFSDWVWIDPANELENKIAIYEFGVLFRAVGLPVTAQGKRQWVVVGDGRTGDSAVGSWGYHDIIYHAYDENDYDANSWGSWIPVSQGFDETYAVQGIAGVSTEMRNRKGLGPSGLNWSKLNADLAKMH